MPPSRSDIGSEIAALRRQVAEIAARLGSASAPPRDE